MRVNGSVYIPLEDRARLERQLRTVAEKAAAIADPCEQSLFLLVHITYLQAFVEVKQTHCKAVRQPAAAPPETKRCS